jgi:hypothetical protein
MQIDISTAAYFEAKWLRAMVPYISTERSSSTLPES